MSDLEQFFQERKLELVEYNDFLNNVVELIEDAHSKPEQTSPELIEQFKKQLPIFKSQVILMLYNLIEGTVNKAITSIFDEVTDANLSHTELSEHLQKIWLKYLTLNVDDDGKHLERILVVNQFVNEPVAIELVKFRSNNKSYFGAGSLDSKRIEDIFKKFSIGIDIKEFKLQEIKSDRNSLTHGEKSFTSVGQEKTVSELLISSGKVLVYLDHFIEKIIFYIEGEFFKNQDVDEL